MKPRAVRWPRLSAFLNLWLIAIPLLLVSLLSPLSILRAAAEDLEAVEPTPKLSEAEQRERAEQLQILTDRLVHKRAQFSMVGTLHREGAQQYSINGERFFISSSTKVIGGAMNSGVSAEVRGFIEPGKPHEAVQVVITGNSPAAGTTPSRSNTGSMIGSGGAALK